jgi:hypothetical protein
MTIISFSKDVLDFIPASISNHYKVIIHGFDMTGSVDYVCTKSGYVEYKNGKRMVYNPHHIEVSHVPSKP